MGGGGGGTQGRTGHEGSAKNMSGGNTKGMYELPGGLMKGCGRGSGDCMRGSRWCVGGV